MPHWFTRFLPNDPFKPKLPQSKLAHIYVVTTPLLINIQSAPSCRGFWGQPCQQMNIDFLQQSPLQYTGEQFCMAEKNCKCSACWVRSRRGNVLLPSSAELMELPVLMLQHLRSVAFQSLHLQSYHHPALCPSGILPTLQITHDATKNTSMFLHAPLRHKRLLASGVHAI